MKRLYLLAEEEPELAPDIYAFAAGINQAIQGLPDGPRNPGQFGFNTADIAPAQPAPRIAGQFQPIPGRGPSFVR
jgi:hypothetical protein